MNRVDYIHGCLMGCVLGDALGAPFEGGLLERGVWWLLGVGKPYHRYTDDTTMTLDVCHSILASQGLEQDDLAQRFARSYRWSRGYGPGAARTLRAIRRGTSWREANRLGFREGSFGNGGAMRSPIVGAIFAEHDQASVERASALVCEITHRHELGIEGARLVSIAAWRAARGLSLGIKDGELTSSAQEFSHRLQWAHNQMNRNREPTTKELIDHLGNGISATESVVTALYLASIHLERPFTELVTSTKRIGGDVDTILAIAGALWGIHRGPSTLSPELVASVEGTERMVTLSERLSQVSLNQI